MAQTISQGHTSIWDTIGKLAGGLFNGNVPVTQQQNADYSKNLAAQQAVPGFFDTYKPPVSQPTPGVAPGPGAVADPYAKYGGQAAYNALASNFGTQKNNIFGTATDAAANAGVGLGNSIAGLIDQLRSGQQSVDNQAIQNELAKRQGVAGVQESVGRGIQSGGVTLANKNASNSSAAGALARAYGDIGRQQLSGVNNQYAQGVNAVNQSQADLEMQRNAGVRNVQDSKTQAVNNIVADARNQLAQLDASIAGASLPDRINIEQEKEKVRQGALNTLQQYDQQLSQGVAGVQAMTPEQRQAQAAQLATAGVAPENAFSYDAQTPLEFQNSGPFASSLPIFTFNRGRKTA